MARRRRRDQQGAAAVEFALIMPIFLMILFGIVDFGYAINRASVVNNAARDAARVASLPGAEVVDIEQAAQGTLGEVPGATVSLTCKKPASVGGSCTFEDRLPGDIAVVTVSYTHSMLTPVGAFFDGGLDLTRRAEMRIEG